MKINTNSVLKNSSKFIKILDPEFIDKTTFASITNLAKYKKALDITETERTEEEKTAAYKLIEEAINNMNTYKEPILVDNLLFAISYPDSYKLVKEYYKTLTNTCLNNKKFMKFDGEKFSPLHTKDNAYVIDKIKQISQSTYALYKPLFNNDNYLINDGNFDERTISRINYKYKLLKIGSNENLQDQKDAYEIYYLIVFSDYTLDKIIKMFKMTDDKIHNILKNNLKDAEYNAVLKKLRENALKNYYQIQNIIEKLYDFIPNGIKTEEGKKISFNMLDYYSLTHISPTTILQEIDKRRPNSKEEAIARAKCKKYLNVFKNQGPLINKEKLLEKNIKIIKENQEYFIADYVDEIFETFKDNNIPTYSFLLESAFSRIAKKLPILPLVEEIEKQKTI